MPEFSAQRRSARFINDPNNADRVVTAPFKTPIVGFRLPTNLRWSLMQVTP